ncbi:MAG: putative Ig domain-containing protein, partial [Gammaproteobacteria bacterium]|nr:putative Ig domain-containing protein [Gammaproteobacteria bacterium]
SSRVLFNTQAPVDTVVIEQTLDAVAPTTTLSVQPLNGGDDYQVDWTAQDSRGGSGVKHVTVYVAENGGDFKIWLKQVPAASDAAIFQGEAGKNYEFIALATDNAGNQELPPIGLNAPSDGTQVNLGELSTVETTLDTTPAPEPTIEPSTNPLFTEAQQGIPSTPPLTQQSEFDSVLNPFTMQSFVTGLPTSGADIGALAIVEMRDGSVLVSGGQSRNWIYKFDSDGGNATSAWAELADPIYNLALDNQDMLWATTGGGELLLLDSFNGSVLARYGESITQAIAVDPITGLLYVSSGNGIEIFNSQTREFKHFSDLRVDDLQFSPQGELWGTSWPDRGTIYKFDNRGKAAAMVDIDGEVDSIAFGYDDTRLAGLLFISSNLPNDSGKGSTLEMVDVATLQRVTLAEGGSRGEVLRTTTDGRLLIAQSHQVDVLSPLIAPLVSSSTPADGVLVPLPLPTISVTFDHDMFVGEVTDLASVINTDNYSLTRLHGEAATITAVRYDEATRTVYLEYDALVADDYTLIVDSSIKSTQGLILGNAYTVQFTTLLNYSEQVNIEFAATRSDRLTGTISYDVQITNTGNADLLAPLTLVLDPAQYFAGEPGMDFTTSTTGLWMIDLSAAVSNGRLASGETTTVQTITLNVQDGLRADVGHGVFAVPYPNELPVFDSTPVTVAIADTTYSYQLVANDPDGVGLTYMLFDAPEGMALDSETGLLSWSPTSESPAQASVVLRVYDQRGGYATQAFAIDVAGGNQAPDLAVLDTEYLLTEGKLFEIGLFPIDAEGDVVLQWADTLPPGASFDNERKVLSWTPGYNAAGIYEGVTLYASDGVNVLKREIRLIVEQGNAAPILTKVSGHTLTEGDTLRFKLAATDYENNELTYYSHDLPGGASINPLTGEFEWNVGYTQAGTYNITFNVTDGENVSETSATFTVLNANGSPVFDTIGSWDIVEGQPLLIDLFAFDPDNPQFTPPSPGPNGAITQPGSTLPSVSYELTGLPEGAIFDSETLTLNWLPGYQQAGSYNVTVTATDDGDGTGTPLSTTTTIPIEVRNANRAPEISEIPNYFVDRGDILEIPVNTTDPDGNPIALSVSNLPRFGSFLDNGDGTGVFRFVPDANDRGDYAVTLTATDNGDGEGLDAILSSSQTFIVTARSVSEAPELDWIGNKVAVVGETLQFTIQAKDLDQDTLNFDVIGLPGGASLTPGSVYGTAIIEWTPTSTDIGTQDLGFTVTDDGNGGQGSIAQDSQTMRIVVRTSNSAPVLNTIGNQTLKEGEAFELTVTGTDADGDVLTYLATNLPEGATLDPQTGVFNWTPNYFQAGFHRITFEVTDGNLSTTEIVDLTVANTNQAPRLGYLSTQTVREGTTLGFSLSGSDPDADPIVYSMLSGIPDGAYFNETSGVFQWTPDFEDAGEYPLTFRVSDANGATDVIDVNVRVSNVNRAPVLEVEKHAVLLGDELRFSVVGHDIDNNTILTYSATGLPEGATLNAATGEILWVPGPAQAGDYLIRVTVSDGEASRMEPLVIRAMAEAELPSVHIETTPSFPAIPGQDIAVNVLGSSFSRIQSLSLTVDGLPVELDEYGRAILHATTSGKLHLVGTATDIDGFTGTIDHTIKVRDPADTTAPVVSFDASTTYQLVTRPVNISGQVEDINLDSWKLEIARAGTDKYSVIAEGE